MEKNERRLTISGKHQPRARQHVEVPEIRLMGKWLEEAGFKKGQKVNIEVQNKKLVLVPIKQKTPSNKR